MAAAPQSSSSSSPFSSSASPYPFATAPDIVRSHQKDAQFTSHLADTLTDLHRRLLGARSAHSFAPELRTLAALLYFGLTTLPGNRTLGEEYCDLVQIDGTSTSASTSAALSSAAAGSLPTLRTRAAYIAGTILLPYLAGRSLPSLRTRIRALLTRRLDTLRRAGRAASLQARALQYLLDHLGALTSAAPVQALTLALFYFNGTYYELGKRLLGLRYVFTRTVPDTPDRAGYEILGILLVVQLAVQGYLHVRDALDFASSSSSSSSSSSQDRPAFHTVGGDVQADVLLGSTAADAAAAAGGAGTNKIDIARATNTPVLARPRFHLDDDKTMGYIKGSQQRKCTLCLEDMRDPAATQCGHVFCWECIGDWVKEKPECPLCRREAMVQHILPLRVV